MQATSSTRWEPALETAFDETHDDRDDRGEGVFAVEPLLVAEESPHRPPLNDLAVELIEASAVLRTAVPAPLRRPLAETVRAMNCYYSNLIEGHDTHPVDIERALRADYSADPIKRELQLEARAHIEVQAWIDEGGLTAHPLALESLLAIHRRFAERLPEGLLEARDEETGRRLRVVPGAFRREFVRVGRHVPPSPGAVPRLLEHMHRGYALPGRLGRVVGIACAHHRLAWVHPFLDLNGRVMRMVAHAMCRDLLGSEGLWSVSRGLARRVDDYRAQLQSADAPRQGDRDGRGNLSEARLAGFAAFFLEVALDQARFMAELMRPAELEARMTVWAREEIEAGRLPPRSDVVLRRALLGGEIARGEVAGLLGVKERQARNVTSALLAAGALASPTSRTPAARSPSRPSSPPVGCRGSTQWHEGRRSPSASSRTPRAVSRVRDSTTS